MSDTPITDKACGWPVGHHGRIDSSDLKLSPDGPFVHSSIARELERENTALREKFMFAESEIILLREEREELREDKERLNFLGTLTGSGWAALHLDRKDLNDDWFLTRKQIDRRMATEAKT